MDVPFDEWVRNDAQQHCVKNWAEALIQLGASWDSFRRHDDASIVQDLVKAGEIPLLAARDIVRIAKLEIERSDAPLAIFWDMENMPIPANISGREVVSRLKTILQPFGRLTQFRGYASIGLNHIPQQKRSDLQLSGCHLVDAPHNGRKEVADKMIIVDAMQFAFLHPKGATLCFITGDVDYAYLLAVLRRPEWRTIVISKGTISSMLHVNCDMRMRWETDILQLRPATMVLVNDETTPTNQVNGTVDATKVLVPRRDLHPQEDRKASRPSARQSRAMSVERTDDDNNNFESTTGFEPLSLSEQWTDDVELLRCILKGNNNSAFKRQVGSQLRTTNPVRFCDQSAVAKFLSKAIEQGVVIESGEGHYKELSLPEAFRTIKCIPTQKFIPVDMYEAVPDRLVKNLEERPFLMFVPKSYFRGGVRKPKGAFVKDSLRRWLLLMYASMEDVQKAVDEMPHLADCTLVDWRTCQSLDERDLCGHCWRCRTGLLESEIIYKTTKGKALGSIYQEAAFCRDCYEWDKGEKKNAVSRVIEMLSMLAENDDILVGRKTLKKFLYLRYSDSGSCTSYKHAELWIDEAIHTEKVTPFKKGGQKKVWVCLPENLDLAHKENEIDCTLNTLGEEEHVLNCLSEVSHSWVTRSSINESLATSFARMNSPLMRAKVFSNGHVSKRFHVAKGPYGQTVGFTEQEAQESLDRMTKSIKGELEWEFEEVSNLTADVATPTSSRKNETEEVLKDLQQTSTATAETVLTSIQDDLPIETSPANANQHNADSDNGDASDDVSEWDGESIDSAEIDARLRRLTDQEGNHNASQGHASKTSPGRLGMPLYFILSLVLTIGVLKERASSCMALATNPITPRFVGFDLGTSGARVSIIEPSSTSREFDEIYSKAIAWNDCGAYDDADSWLGAIESLLRDASEALEDGLDSVSRICFSGTSASCLVVDRSSQTVTRSARMYDFDILSSASSEEGKRYAEQALECIEKHVPPRHTARARTGSLAKLVSWAYESPWKDCEVLLHQSDFLSMKLMEDCSPVRSDWHNCLKLGYDVRNKCWPTWMKKCLLEAGISSPLDKGSGAIPTQVVSPGEPIGTISKSMAKRMGLPEDTILVGGTTDSNAAFFAAAGVRPPMGTAVTSLGSTTAIKLLSQQYIEDADRGVYSHRFPTLDSENQNEDAWLVGGASNVGCAIFRKLDFSNDELAELSQLIDPTVDSQLKYYPLVKTGERFPNADSNKEPILSPVPDSRQDYLHGLLQSISMVEMEGFQVLHELGAPLPKVIFSCGGGSKNSAWTKMRRRILAQGLGVSDVEMDQASNTEASFGAALLAAAMAA